MKGISDFTSILKAEIIKENVRYIANIVMLCTFLLGLAIYKICAFSVDYTEMNLDSYYCVVLFTVGLLIVLPAGVWLINISEVAIEKSNRGWLLVCASSQNRKCIIIAKHIVNIFIVALFYILLFLEASIVMRGRGMEALFQVLLIPLCVSFFVTIPQLLLVQFFCYIVENDVITIMTGLLYTIITFSLAHTKYSDYLFTTYPYSISATFENVLPKVLVCVILEIVLMVLGAIPLKIIQKRI